MALAGAMDVSYVPDAILSRSITIHMQRALPGEVKERWNERIHASEIEPLCWLLRYWIELVHSYAREHRPDIPESLTNRDADKFEPLLTVADLAGGRWPELARVTAVTAVTASGASEPSEGMRLLWEIQAIFDRLNVAHISTRELVAELDETGEFAWSRLPAQRAGISMANILKGYGVRPGSFRDGTKTFKGYQWGAFTDAWLRYPPPSGDSGDSGDNEGGDDE
jgi:hypothetical protein